MLCRNGKYREKKQDLPCGHEAKHWFPNICSNSNKHTATQDWIQFVTLVFIIGRVNPVQYEQIWLQPWCWQHWWHCSAQGDGISAAPARLFFRGVWSLTLVLYNIKILLPTIMNMTDLELILVLGKKCSSQIYSSYNRIQRYLFIYSKNLRTNSVSLIAI